MLQTVAKPVDEWKRMADLKTPRRDILYKVDIPPLEKPKGQMEGNCYFRILRSVLQLFGKRFTPEQVLKIKVHLGSSRTGFSLRKAHVWLEEMGIDAMMENDVSYDRLRLAIKNGIPTVLVFKAPYDFSFNLDRDLGNGYSLFQRYDNHTVLLAGIDEQTLYCVDPMYKDGQVLCKVPINHFVSKWTMEYDDHDYTSSYFSRVERVAIFYSAFTCERVMKPPKNSIWKHPAENPRNHLEGIQVEEPLTTKIRRLTAEIRERHRLSQQYRYYDYDLAQAKSSLKIAIRKKHSLDPNNPSTSEKVKQLFEACTRLDQVDQKLKKKGLKA